MSFGASGCPPQGIQKWLRAMTQDAIVGGEVRVGHSGEIRSLLQWARTPETAIGPIMDILRRGLDGSLDDPILSETISIVMKSQEDFRLTLCVLSEACEFKVNARAAYVAGLRPDFMVIRLLNVTHLSDKALSKVIQKSLAAMGNFGTRDANSRRALLVNPHPKVKDDLIGDMTSIVDQFFHEATHYADDVLFTDWVLANKKLIGAGHKPGNLFQNVTRMVDGQIYISKEFQTFFTEIRAYHVTAYLLTLLQGISPSSDQALEIRQQVSRQAYEALVIDGAKPYLDGFNIGPRDILDYRDVFSKIMRTDIQAAQSL